MDARSAYATVEAKIRVGESFEHIEAFIDEHVINRDLANVLWLLAWAEADADERRSAVRELLVGLTAI